MTCLVSPNFDQFLNKWRVYNIIFSSYGYKHIFSLCNDTKVMFVWDYNLSRLYNPINFELTFSSKFGGLYNLGRL
jgi:hypothetical protein